MDAETLARSIVTRLTSRGHAAFLVGGCVRDLLLGRKPADFDVATSARPQELLALFPHAGQVGAHFGVVLVREDGAQVEVATFRSDLEYRDGRHPDGVRFESDPREDVRRRDFTINALLLDPVTDEVLDFTGGRADLAAGVIRAIGDPATRIREDHLRLMRAVRFAARFRFEIEPVTLAAIRDMAAKVCDVAAERLRDEISRILTEGGPRYGFELLDRTGLLHEVLPEVEKMKGVEQPPEFHPEGDVWTHTLIMLDGLREPSIELALGVLLHDIGKPDTFRVAERIRFDGHVEKGVEIAQRILRRLKYPNGVIDAVETLIANHMKFKDAPHMRESRLKRFMRMPEFEEHMELHRLDCTSSHGSLDNYDFIREKQARTPVEDLKPAPLITGRDLIAEGFKPGPMFGKVLSEIEDGQLEGRIRTREEALAIVRERLFTKLS